MGLAEWTTLAAYLDSSLGAITGVKEVVNGDLSARQDYSTELDMVAFYASLGETPNTTQSSMQGSSVSFERLRLRIGIVCKSTTPSGSNQMIAHYLLSDWRTAEWLSSFGGVCGWKAISGIVDKSSGVPMSYFDIDVEIN